ncbi:unnamed protein product [Brassica oleracea var. botrytis]|uniref:(rape) hypothetical protein n=1 Tax=Brassica napus TaxID=3708 RepID=A0A816IRT3_BRANA|nr:unnamed protein product [Brassica napus]
MKAEVPLDAEPPSRTQTPPDMVLTLHGATTSYNTFPLSDAHVSIRFTDGTTFEELTDSDKSIPTEMFRFRNYDQLLALANTNRHLPHTLLKQPHAEEPEQVALSNRKDRSYDVDYIERSHMVVNDLHRDMEIGDLLTCRQLSATSRRVFCVKSCLLIVA